MNNDQIKPQSYWPKRLSWLTILLAVLTVISFLAVSNPDNYYIQPMGMGGGVMEGSPDVRMMSPTTASMPAMNVDSKMIYPYPYPNPDQPISDSREFLKVSYNVNIRNRDVQGLTRRAETVVRGYDGRIDQISSSEKYGFISFAMSQGKYNAFRAEIESLVNKKFLVINISSQNLLSQKVSIEEQQKQADKSLADQKLARQKINSNHNSTVASLQARINEIEKELATLRAQTETPQVNSQIKILSIDLSSYKKRLDDENASYKIQLDSADQNIKYAEEWKKAVETQDKTLLENVATVSGTISIQWISFWDMLQTYLPGYWIPFIFAILTTLSFLRDKRRFGTV